MDLHRTSCPNTDIYFMFLIWLQFFICAFIIIVAGKKLSLYVDDISEKTGLSKAWAGMILLGVVTSLPEVVTSLTSVTKINAPDLALGNVLGSNIFNLMIIPILDFMYGHDSITSKVSSNHSYILSGAFTLTLSTIVIAGIFINRIVNGLNIFDVGMDSIAIAIICLIGLRLIFKSETETLPHQSIDERTKPIETRKINLARVYLGFIISGILVIASGIWLASIGDRIANITGWGKTFVGSIFLAIVTSFPELVVSLTTLRLGAIDLAFGNIFGSNTFNLFIIPITDIAYRAGVILAFVSRTHILTACLGIFLTCIAIIGLSLRKKKTFLNLSWDTIIMVLSYLFGTYMLFRLR